MDTNPISISEELYFHRVFMRTNREPSVIDVEPIVGTTEILTFISDGLDHALFVRDIEGWVSPFDAGEIQRDNTVKRHFNFDIGDAIVHRCAIEESFRIAEENAFDADKLLDLPTQEATVYVQKFIGLVVVNTRPVNISFIYALAFACSLCGIAAENCKLHLMSCVALSTAFIFQLHFPYEWIYYDFKQWAFAYIFRHKQIHGG
ncbi:hypothetical protein AVEN_44832-1 [Araneus ventricosus]|uniref:Uncharacterized protein n=1 Tax=Araneus ventricosus TaxID=182803 RepID=A0A4Y2CK20_ARAVE|nr:hypothetical protein AVEN_44832-1 [Araneus ventricosus]